MSATDTPSVEIWDPLVLMGDCYTTLANSADPDQTASKKQSD